MQNDYLDDAQAQRNSHFFNALNQILENVTQREMGKSKKNEMTQSRNQHVILLIEDISDYGFQKIQNQCDPLIRIDPDSQEVIKVLDLISILGAKQEANMIGHERESCTTPKRNTKVCNTDSYPITDTKMYKDNIGIIDDLRQKINLAVQVCSCKSIRLILVINYYELITFQEKAVKKAIQIAARYVKDLEKHIENVQVLFTQVGESVRRKQIAGELLSILENEKKVLEPNQLVRLFLKHMIKQLVHQNQEKTVWPVNETNYNLYFTQIFKFHQFINDPSSVFDFQLSQEQIGCIKNYCKQVIAHIAKSDSEKDFNVVFKLLDHLLVLKNFNLPCVDKIYQNKINKIETHYVGMQRKALDYLLAEIENKNQLNSTNFDKVGEIYHYLIFLNQKISKSDHAVSFNCSMLGLKYELEDKLIELAQNYISQPEDQISTTMLPIKNTLETLDLLEQLDKQTFGQDKLQNVFEKVLEKYKYILFKSYKQISSQLFNIDLTKDQLAEKRQFITQLSNIYQQAKQFTEYFSKYIRNLDLVFVMSDEITNQVKNINGKISTEIQSKLQNIDSGKPEKDSSSEKKSDIQIYVTFIELLSKNASIQQILPNIEQEYENCNQICIKLINNKIKEKAKLFNDKLNEDNAKGLEAFFYRIRDLQQISMNISQETGKQIDEFCKLLCEQIYHYITKISKYCQDIKQSENNGNDVEQSLQYGQDMIDQKQSKVPHRRNQLQKILFKKIEKITNKLDLMEMMLWLDEFQGTNRIIKTIRKSKQQIIEFIDGIRFQIDDDIQETDQNPQLWSQLYKNYQLLEILHKKFQPVMKGQNEKKDSGQGNFELIKTEVDEKLQIKFEEINDTTYLFLDKIKQDKLIDDNSILETDELLAQLQGITCFPNACNNRKENFKTILLKFENQLQEYIENKAAFIKMDSEQIVAELMQLKRGEFKTKFKWQSSLSLFQALTRQDEQQKPLRKQINRLLVKIQQDTIYTKALSKIDEVWEKLIEKREVHKSNNQTKLDTNLCCLTLEMNSQLKQYLPNLQADIIKPGGILADLFENAEQLIQNKQWLDFQQIIEAETQLSNEGVKDYQVRMKKCKQQINQEFQEQVKKVRQQIVFLFQIDQQEFQMILCELVNMKQNLNNLLDQDSLNSLESSALKEMDNEIRLLQNWLAYPQNQINLEMMDSMLQKYNTLMKIYTESLACSIDIHAIQVNHEKFVRDFKNQLIPNFIQQFDQGIDPEDLNYMLTWIQNSKEQAEKAMSQNELQIQYQQLFDIITQKIKDQVRQLEESIYYCSQNDNNNNFSQLESLQNSYIKLCQTYQKKLPIQIKDLKQIKQSVEDNLDNQYREILEIFQQEIVSPEQIVQVDKQIDQQFRQKNKSYFDKIRVQLLDERLNLIQQIDQNLKSSHIDYQQILRNLNILARYLSLKSICDECDVNANTYKSTVQLVLCQINQFYQVMNIKMRQPLSAYRTQNASDLITECDAEVQDKSSPLLDKDYFTQFEYCSKVSNLFKANQIYKDCLNYEELIATLQLQFDISEKISQLQNLNQK